MFVLKDRGPCSLGHSAASTMAENLALVRAVWKDKAWVCEETKSTQEVV